MFNQPILLAAATAAETGGLGGLVHTFGIDWKVIVAQAVNFVLVAFILWKLAFKPVIASLDERRQKIADGLQFAEEARQQLADAEKRQAETLREANANAQAILHAAHDKAKAFEEQMRRATTAELEEMRRRTTEANELERQKMLSEVRQEIARLVVLTSARVLQSELDETERTRIAAAASREIAAMN
jgi:F-type H+-transporting ATPase subunit b